MSKPSEELIYDRTLSDVTSKLAKGNYNASDLNRIEEWTKYLSEELNGYNYNTNLEFKTDWNKFDLADMQSNIDRIKNNINTLKDAYYTFSTTPTTAEGKTSINYSDANDIEKILYDLNSLLEAMPLSFRYSDYLVSGDDIGLIDCKE